MVMVYRPMKCLIFSVLLGSIAITSSESKTLADHFIKTVLDSHRKCALKKWNSLCRITL